MAKLSVQGLKELSRKLKEKKRNQIKVGYSTCGIAAGAAAVYDTLVEEVKRRQLDVEVQKCGCIGMCYAEPLVEVNIDGVPKVFYGKVDREAAVKIVDKHVSGKILVNDKIYDVKLTR